MFRKVKKIFPHFCHLWWNKSEREQLGGGFRKGRLGTVAGGGGCWRAGCCGEQTHPVASPCVPDPPQHLLLQSVGGAGRGLCLRSSR